MEACIQGTAMYKLLHGIYWSVKVHKQQMLVWLRDAFHFQFTNLVLRHFFLKRPKYDKKYNICICGIFKDEAPFLREWIEYHEMIGVEHFWLYNNNSRDNYKEVLEPYIQRGLVSLIDWPYNQAQMKAYKDFYDRYRHETQWYSFLDIDEFIVPKYEMSILAWLKKSGLDRFPAIVMFFRMFGTSGRMHHDFKRLVTEQYHVCWERLYDVGKCLVNSDFDVAEFNGRTHHCPLMVTHILGFKHFVRPFNMYGRMVRPEDTEERSLKDVDATIQVNHYWSKAWDVFEKKRRGTDVYFERNPKLDMSYFYRHEDKNISVDYTITKFIIRLKLKMGIKD